MLGWLFRRNEPRPRPRSRSRLAGCLVWILALIALLIILSLLFGGFRKGTKAAGYPGAAMVAMPATVGFLTSA